VISDTSAMAALTSKPWVATENTQQKLERRR
jgi:hypothetical protein